MKLYQFNHYIKNYEWVNDVRGFVPFVKELKKHVFRIKNEYISKAKEILYESLKAKNKENLIPNNTSVKHRALVSIHIRIQDYEENHLKRLFHLPPASPAYFSKAMQHFVDKYKVLVGLNKGTP